MNRIKKTAAFLAVLLLSVSLVSCGKERSPLEQLAGYYEADLDEVIESLYPDLSEDEADAVKAGLLSKGYLVGIKIDKEGNGTWTVESDGAVQSSENMVFDPDTGTVTVNGEKLSYTYASRTIEYDGLSYVRTSSKTEPVWPFGAAVSLGGDFLVGYFWVPEDWADATDLTSEDYIVTYQSPDGKYSISVYNYLSDEWQGYDTDAFESPESLVEALTSSVRSKYASSIDTDDTFNTDVEGDQAVRNDMFFNDGDGITYVVSIDDEETYRVFCFETFGEEATGYMDEFVEYVLGHYHKSSE